MHDSKSTIAMFDSTADYDNTDIATVDLCRLCVS
jgi:hypothetical protein